MNHTGIAIFSSFLYSCPPSSPQLCLNAGFQFPHAEWLSYIIISAEEECAVQYCYIIHCCEHDYRDVPGRLEGFYSGADVEAVYFGHGYTPNSFTKWQKVQWFFDSTNKRREEQKKFLIENSIIYIITEKQQSDFNEVDFLKPVFQSGEVIIYKVMQYY